MTLHRPALSIFALLTLILGACAFGSAIVTGTTRAPVAPEQVRIYLEPPPDFEIIGIVNASSDAGLTEQGSQDYAIKELKKQAAKLGANGILLISSGERTTTDGYAKTVQGKAIFVKGQ